MLVPVLLIVLAAQDTSHKAIPPDSYADSATALLVRNARSARSRTERLVTAFTAKVSQRLGVGIHALSRDRMLYHQEMVARISWLRDAPSKIEVVGAREGIPVAQHADQLPDDLRSDARDLVMDPAADYLRVLGSDPQGFVYPLRENGELDYRFAIGDTTVITLPTGVTIRLLALKVIPRRSDFRLIAGTLWFDAASFGIVRAVFRPARPYDMRRDAPKEDLKGVPGFVNAQAEVKFVTIEYGFYENRWWMPRYMALDLDASMGSMMRVPVKIERVYDDYEVAGGTPPDPKSTFRPAGAVTPRDSTPFVRDSTGHRRRASAARDSTCDSTCRRKRREAVESNLVVIIPKDSMSLLTSSELGPPILQMGDMISEKELESLRGAIGALPDRPWETRLVLPHGVASALLEHARYNRIEALSLGLHGQLDLGRLQVDGLGRYGFADHVVNGELSVTRKSADLEFRLVGYRRLETANPDAAPFSIGNSIDAFVAQTDEGDYYRTLGVEFTAENRHSEWWSARVYYQRERSADVETAVSLPHLFNKNKVFRDNIVADSALELGGALTLRATKIMSRSFTLSSEMTVDGAMGDFDFGRGALTLRAIVTSGGPIAGAVTASAGTSTGPVPVQHGFYLGGPGGLRGYASSDAIGNAFWLARGEVGNSFPAVRVILFSDVGWAGNRMQFASARPLVDVGVGLSLLDGLVRIDLARGLRAPQATRLLLYFDGVL